MEKNSVRKTVCRVNLLYLPIKAHYFFLFGAMGGTVPFMPVLAKGLGINATAVGLIYTVLPFCVFLSKPIFGYITDYFQNIKWIMFILVTVTSVSFVSVLFIPPLNEKEIAIENILVRARCFNDTHNLILLPLSNEHCSMSNATQEAMCEISNSDCNFNANHTLQGLLNLEKVAENGNTTSHFMFKPLETNFTCDCFTKNASTIKCKSNVLTCTLTDDQKPVYKTYNFWVFTLLAVIAGTGSATTFCLSDAACYEVLKDSPKLYGRQRLWATIGWGLVTSFAGFLNDLATGDSPETDYSSGFYLMAGFVLIDLVILSRIHLVKANISISICKDVGKIFASCETIIFAIGVYIAGALTGLIWNYQFWFLEDMGASQTLMGLTVAVQCLVAEVPFFFFSGWVIRKFGHFYCFFASLTAFALRLGLYYILQNPWLTLPIEVLHGVTFAVFYATMTSYASARAPPGTEATMLGVLGGLFEGLGVATGSLLGGVGFDKLGGKETFLAASIISLVSLPAFVIAYVLVKRFSPSEGRVFEPGTESTPAKYT